MTATAFRIGANWPWNSGALAKRTFRAFRRNLQVRVEQGEEYHVVLEVGVRPAPDSRR